MHCKIIKFLFLISGVILLLWGIQSLIPEIQHGHYNAENYKYFRREVLQVENDITAFEIKQQAKVKVKNGLYQGAQIYLNNFYRKKDRYSDVLLKKGLEIIMYSYYQHGD